jgi:hypothetical protein
VSSFCNSNSPGCSQSIKQRCHLRFAINALILIQTIDNNKTINQIFAAMNEIFITMIEVFTTMPYRSQISTDFGVEMATLARSFDCETIDGHLPEE